MEETGKKVSRSNVIYQNPEHPFMLANVDRMVVGEDAGLECKTASAYSADKWKDGRIPESYQIQCHHYMAVTGVQAWYIAVVILGKDFLWHRIERDKELIGNAHADKSIVLTGFDRQLKRRAEIMALMDKLDTEKNH